MPRPPTSELDEAARASYASLCDDELRRALLASQSGPASASMRWAEPVEEAESIEQSIAIRIRVQDIRSIVPDLIIIRELIFIRIPRSRISSIIHDLFIIVESIFISVSVVWMRAIGMNLIIISESIIIGI